MAKPCRLGIYGGTFDPVHLGHMRAAHAFVSLCALDRLYMLPTAKPPHKEQHSDVSPADRMEMLRLAVADTGDDGGRLIPSDYEQKRGGKSYTVLTLEHFRAESPDLFLLCGTDMFLTLDTWFRAEDIFRLAAIVCFAREAGGRETEAIRSAAETFRKTYDARILLPDFTPLPVSSTEIRQEAADGRISDALLSPSVRDYIHAHGLYRAPTERTSSL